MIRKRLGAVVAALAAGVLLVGCGGNDSGTDASPSPSQTTSTGDSPSNTEAMFAGMMADHHQDGIKLAQLVTDKATTPEVKQLAQRSLQSQQAELPQLQQAAEAADMASMAPEAPLIRFNVQEMAELDQLTRTQFDLKWLDVFSSHHMSAIMMADMVRDGDGQVADLAKKIHDEQLKDVQEMNTLRDKLRG